MAQATNSSLGQIVLSGDLFGTNANQPELVHSGVVPGNYKPAKKIHVDSKGRLTWAGPASWENDLYPYAQNASKTQKGVFQVGYNIDVTDGTISINNASADNAGVFQLGFGMSINQSTGAVDVSVQDASASNLGVVQVSDGFEVAAGVLSRAGFGNATASYKGMVKVGTNFNIDYGTISVPYATASTPGVVSVDGTQLYLDSSSHYIFPHSASSFLYGMIYGFTSDFSIDGNGVLSFTSPYTNTIASASTLGKVKIGSGLFMTGDDALTVAKDASASDKGFVEVSTGFTVTSGTLSAPLGGTTGWGLLCVGDTTINGSMSYNLAPISAPGAPEDGTTGLRFRRCDTVNPANIPLAGAVRSGNMNNISIVNGIIDVGVNIPKKNETNIYTKAQVCAKQSYVDADWSRGSVIELVMTGNVSSVPAPTNAVDGQVITLLITQDSTGGRTLTGWNSVYKFQGGVAPTLSTTPNTTDIFTIIRKSSTEYYVLYTKGFQ
jgi:hypothetical protein